MRNIHVLIAILLCALKSEAQIHFQKTYNGIGNDLESEFFQTSDGGYMISNHFVDSADYIALIKTNDFGDTVWAKRYGPISAPPQSRHVEEIYGIGYLMTFNITDTIIVLVRMDLNGDTLWSKKMGGVILGNGCPISDYIR